MTNDEYWQDLYAYRANRLPQYKVLKYKLAGVFSESAARQQGTTLIPFGLEVGNSPPELLPEDLLVAIGLTALVLGGESCDRS